MTPQDYTYGLIRFADLVLDDDRERASETLYKLTPEALREVVAGATGWIYMSQLGGLRRDLERAAKTAKEGQHRPRTGLRVVKEP